RATTLARPPEGSMSSTSRKPPPPSSARHDRPDAGRRQGPAAARDRTRPLWRRVGHDAIRRTSAAALAMRRPAGHALSRSGNGAGPEGRRAAAPRRGGRMDTEATVRPGAVGIFAHGPFADEKMDPVRLRALLAEAALQE